MRSACLVLELCDGWPGRGLTAAGLTAAGAWRRPGLAAAGLVRSQLAPWHPGPHQSRETVIRNRYDVTLLRS